MLATVQGPPGPWPELQLSDSLCEMKDIAQKCPRNLHAHMFWVLTQMIMIAAMFVARIVEKPKSYKNFGLKNLAKCIQIDNFLTS